MPERIHLLLGPETGQKDEYIAQIRESLTKQFGDLLEIDRVYPYNIGSGDLVSLLHNSPLFAEHRLVLVSQAEQYGKKEDVARLASYIERPSEASTLMLLSDEFHLEKPVERAATKKRIRVFWELFENQKMSFVQQFFRGAGFTITSGAVELVLDLVQNDTLELRRECEKLTQFFPKERQITETEVEKVLFHSKNESVFSLFDRIARSDLPAALETLHAIVLASSLEPAQILGGVIWQIRRLLDFRRLKDQNLSDKEIGRKLKIRGKRNLQMYQSGSNNYTSPDLERVFLRTVEYDVFFRQIRTGIDRRLLELYLYEVITTRGKHPLVPAVR